MIIEAARMTLAVLQHYLQATLTYFLEKPKKKNSPSPLPISLRGDLSLEIVIS
jgi:hypothetical protein